MIKQTYQFDSFQDEEKKSEIARLTANVGSHSKALTEHFLSNGSMTATKILDVGCGTGAMINMFAELLPQAEFVGLDNSDQIIETANAQSQSSVQFVKGNALQLPFEDHTFDFVYTRLVLMHNQHPEQIISEMKRVCKPNGTIIAVELDDETVIFHPFAEELSQLIKANIAFAKRVGTDRIIGRKLFSMFKSVGLESVHVITQTSDYDGPYDEGVPFSLRLAIGSGEARHLVEAGLITEEQRIDWMEKIKQFCNDPNRFYSGSFMYCVGKK